MSTECTEIIRSAREISFHVLATPSSSMGVWGSLKPAVSTRVIGTPPTTRSDVIVSRVVPAMSLVMLLFESNSAFIKVDLPAFVWPQITTLTPCWYALLRT